MLREETGLDLDDVSPVGFAPVCNVHLRRRPSVGLAPLPFSSASLAESGNGAVAMVLVIVLWLLGFIEVDKVLGKIGCRASRDKASSTGQ